MKRTLATLLLIVLLTGTLAVVALATPAPNTDMIKAFQKTPLPLDKYKGKVLLLFFFVENNTDSRLQLVEMKNIYEEYDPQQLQIILVHEWQKENAKNTQKAVEDLALQEMTIFEDKGIKLAKKLKIPSVPTTYIINQEGLLAEAFAYGLPYEELERVLDGLGVGKRSAAMATTDVPAAAPSPSTEPSPSVAPSRSAAPATTPPPGPTPTLKLIGVTTATPSPTPSPSPAYGPTGDPMPSRRPPASHKKDTGAPEGSIGIVK